MARHHPSVLFLTWTQSKYKLENFASTKNLVHDCISTIVRSFSDPQIKSILKFHVLFYVSAVLMIDGLTMDAIFTKQTKLTLCATVHISPTLLFFSISVALR